jgi:hypothetical protein
MNEKLVALVGVLLLLLSGGVAAYVTGTGPFQAASSGEDISAFPTETTEIAETAATDGDSDPSAGGAASSPPFDFTVGAIEECGRTCRDVTSTLTNQQNSTAESITVYTRIYAGNTTNGDAVWEGSEDVGRLEPDRSYTTTRRVDLSFGDAYAIEQADGWITVQTTVETADRTVTISEQRDVT